MQEATCNQCGASGVLSAKFCRQCGNRLDASEMTTRNLDAPSAVPPPFDHPTRPANAGITSPTYAPPAMMSPQPPAPIIGNAPSSNNQTALLVFLALGLTLLIGLAVVAFVVIGRFSHGGGPPPPPDISSTHKGSSGGAIAPPPPPPPGVPPPPGNVKNPFDASLIYPGAKTVMSVNSKDGNVAQLVTSDPFDKVADWYVEKINPTEDTNLPGSRILKGRGITVILAGSREGTHITLTDDKN
jgi:hypothetical protein